MYDTIEDQIHYMLAIEHLAAARLELHEATKRQDGNTMQYAFEGIDRAIFSLFMVATGVGIVLARLLLKRWMP